jgi:hypothetical protein
MQIKVRISMRTANGRPLKARRITGNSSELLLPQPPHHLLRRLNAIEIWRWAKRQLLALIVV